MQNPKFKVIAELRNDLTENDREFAMAKMQEWQNKFDIKALDDHTYCKNTNEETYKDCSSVAFFFCILKQLYLEYFSKLEYSDLWHGETSCAV